MSRSRLFHSGPFLLLTLLLSWNGAAGPLAEAFSGAARWAEDSTFQPPASCRYHAEYSTAFFNGQYCMFFRTFRNPDGTYGDITGIGLATSIDGQTWTDYNGGRPVLANRTYTDGSGTHVIRVYSPAVITDGGQLVMVYEVMDEDVPGSNVRPRHWVEAATSNDGITWQAIMDGANPRKILLASMPWEGLNGGVHTGNVGTPSLHKFDGTYYVTYHGFDGTDGTNSLLRGLAYGSSLTSLARHSSPILLPPVGWGNVGIGRADIHYEAGYYYMVFEALANTAFCTANVVAGWGIARSTDLFNWQHSDRNPVRIDRVAAACGEDMPAFQIIGGEAFVVSTTSNLGEIPTVRRYKIILSSRWTTASPAVAVAGTPAGDGYRQVLQNGQVLSWGAATWLGDAALPEGAEPVDIVSTPSGNGYWIALNNGGVRAFGASGHHGSMEGSSLAQPVSGMEPTPNGLGYWLVAEDGGIFTFGNAGFFGSLGGSPPPSPVVDIAARPAGNGYWLLTAAGTVHPFGAAAGLGNVPAGNADSVAIHSSNTGNGYTIVTATGNVFSFGDAPFYGSCGGVTPSPIVGGGPCRISAGLAGYWLTAHDGGIVEFGGARFFGDPNFSTTTNAADDWMVYQ